MSEPELVTAADYETYIRPHIAALEAQVEELKTELRRLKMEAEMRPPPESARWNRQALDGMYQSMLGQPGEAVRFELERTPEAIARDDPQATFSPGAVDEVLMGMRAWLFSRIHRFYAQHDAPARRGEIVIHVELAQ